MPKPLVLIGGAVGAVVVIGGVVMLTGKKDTPVTDNSSKTGSTSEKTSSIKANDPNGDYAFFSDPSVTKHPENGALFGSGQTLTFEYDGSKTNNDDYATLSYQLYFIQDNGGVIAMGGGNIEGRGKGVFTMNNKVYASNAKNRSGFLELTGTWTEGTKGTNVRLGMYPIKFDISE